MASTSSFHQPPQTGQEPAGGPADTGAGGWSLEDVVDVPSDSVEEILIAITGAIVIAAIAGVVVAALRKAVLWLWQRAFAGRGSDDGAGEELRSRLRPYGYPLMQPVFACGGKEGRILVDLVRKTGTIPLRGYHHPSRLMRALRWVKLNFFCFDTDPKTAFAIEEWGSDPERGLGSPGFFGHSSGQVVWVELAEGESRCHLAASLSSGRKPERRLVAVGPVEALANPDFLVTCLVVDAMVPNEPEDQPSKVGVVLSPVEGAVYQARRQDVCDDALWLFRLGRARRGKQWGCPADEAESPAAVNQLPKDHYNHVEGARKKERRWQRYWWLFAGLGVCLAAMLPTVVVVGLEQSSTDEVWVRVVVHLLALWIFVFLVMTLWWLVRWTCHWFLRRGWLKSGRPNRDGRWTGGTGECLRLGWLYRGGPRPDKKGWKQYWQQKAST